MRKQNAAFHATKRSDRPEIATKKLRNKVVKMLREAKNSYLNRLNLGSKKQFWKAVKILSKQQSMIPTLHHQEATAETNYEKATMLNGYFSSCFNASVPPLSQLDEENQTHIESGSTCPEDLLCTTEEVLLYIQALDATKASGPDGISIRMLKYTATSIAPSLLNFQYFHQTRALSNLLRYTVPVPKSSKHNEVANYRPISLLPVVSKLLERHIHQVITTHLNETRPLSNKQWGFQPGKFTVTALLAVTHDWLKALESRHNVCSVFLDLRKAFDSVSHRLLLEKLNTCTGFLHPFMVTQLPRWKKTTCGRWWWLISWFTCALRSSAGLRFGSTIISHLYWWCVVSQAVWKHSSKPVCRWHAPIQTN